MPNDATFFVKIFDRRNFFPVFQDFFPIGFRAPKTFSGTFLAPRIQKLFPGHFWRQEFFVTILAPGIFLKNFCRNFFPNLSRFFPETILGSKNFFRDTFDSRNFFPIFQDFFPIGFRAPEIFSGTLLTPGTFSQSFKIFSR